MLFDYLSVCVAERGSDADYDNYEIPFIMIIVMFTCSMKIKLLVILSHFNDIVVMNIPQKTFFVIQYFLTKKGLGESQLQ